MPMNNKNKMKNGGGGMAHVFSDVQFLSDNFDPSAEFEILTSDKQYDSRYGVFQYTENDLNEICDNFNSGVRGVEVAVDINHDREKKAYAWIEPKSMRVGESSALDGKKSIFCRLYRYTPEGLELMKTGAYRYFSVELMLKWERFVGGVKKIFKNVLFGLALTNSPVIKDMKPTYSDNFEDVDPLLLNSNQMELFKQFLSLLKGKEIVTKDEKTTMKSMLTSLSEDDQKAVAGEVAEVEKKKEEAPNQDAQLAEEANKKLTLAEQALEKNNKRLSELELENKKSKLAEKANALILSANVPTGFIPKDKQAVVDFMVSLSEDQLQKFEDLMKNVKSLKFDETGKEVSADLSEDAKEKEVEALADKILSDNKDMPRWQALDKAYAQLDMKK